MALRAGARDRTRSLWAITASSALLVAVVAARLLPPPGPSHAPIAASYDQGLEQRMEAIQSDLRARPRDARLHLQAALLLRRQYHQAWARLQAKLDPHDRLPSSVHDDYRVNWAKTDGQRWLAPALDHCETLLASDAPSKLKRSASAVRFSLRWETRQERSVPAWVVGVLENTDRG